MESYYIGAVATVGIFLLSHLALAVWFAAKMSTKVSEMADTIKEMSLELKSLGDFSTRLAVLEERMNRTESDIREVVRTSTLLAKAIPPSGS